MNENKYIIRTSDRKSFKKCRVFWDFTSKIREDWEPNRTYDALHFGTAFHAALEQFYLPDLWKIDRGIALNLAKAKWLEAYTYIGIEDDAPGIDEWEVNRTLGLAMLENYAKWSAPLDNFNVVFREREFEVPVKVPDGATLAPNFTKSVDGDLLYHGLPVVYQGRIDGLIEAEDGYYIWDDKTAGKFGSTEWLDLEDQISSYCWALQQELGLPIKGFIYQEHRKAVPKPPKVLKSGKLSQDKSQETTYDLYMKALDEHGLNVVEYQDFLDFLKEAEKPYFRRTQLHKTAGQLRLVGERIFMEAVEMIGNPSIYPTPTPMNCNTCAFFSPCLAKNEGSDYLWILDSNYHQRKVNG